MEVKVGVLNTPRELVVDSTLSQDEVQELVEKALHDKAGVLGLTDERGRRVLVPVSQLAYVEIAESDHRRVGFSS